MSQPAQCPIAFATLVMAVAGEIIAAIAGRPGYTPEQKDAKEQATVRLIMAFLPRDAEEILAAAHTVLFNEATAEAARDLFGGRRDGDKPKTRAALVNFGKMTLRNMAELRALRKRPADSAIPEPVRDEKPAASASEPSPPPAKPEPVRPEYPAPRAAPQFPTIPLVPQRPGMPAGQGAPGS